MGFSCLHRRPDGAVHLLSFFFFLSLVEGKKLPSDQLFWVVDNRCCCSLVCEKSATHLPSCAEKGLLEAFSVCESHLRHKAKSWRSMYISWPASRSPFSLKTSGLTHAQNQPPFVQPLQTRSYRADQRIFDVRCSIPLRKSRKPYFLSHRDTRLFESLVHIASVATNHRHHIHLKHPSSSLSCLISELCESSVLHSTSTVAAPL